MGRGGLYRMDEGGGGGTKGGNTSRREPNTWKIQYVADTLMPLTNVHDN